MAKKKEKCVLDELPDLLHYISMPTYPYRENGYCVISGSSSKPTNFVAGESGITPKAKCDVYACTEVIRKKLKSKKWKKITDPGSDEHVARYYFDHGENFKNGSTPYLNEGHHLIPHTSSFETFTDKQMEILKKIDYNVNNGNNIIFLPKLVGDCAFHNLPYHSGSHGQYTDQVKADFKEIKDSLNKVKADPCEVIEPLQSIKDYFYKIQDDYWKLIVKSGKKGQIASKIGVIAITT